MSEPVFLLALAFVAVTVIMTAKSIASAIAGRGTSRSELTELRDQLDQHAAALDDAEKSIANQATHLAEIQERLDFAERLLAQGRDRAALKPGDKE